MGTVTSSSVRPFDSRPALTGTTAVRYLKGVGPRGAELLKKLGIVTVEDLLLTGPRDYEDRTHPTPIASVTPQDSVFIKGKIVSVIPERTRRGFAITKVIVGDGTGQMTAVWFNQPFLESQFMSKLGAELFISGKVDYESFRGELTISVREYEWVEAGTLTTGIVPRYALTEGVTQKMMRRMIATALASNPALGDPIPADLSAKLGLHNRAAAVIAIHQPKTIEQAQKARERFVFEDFFFFQLGVLMMREKTRSAARGPVMVSHLEDVARFEEQLPFTLTAAQKRVMEEIGANMAGDSAMSRLLQGDVGSGKTVVAAFAAWKAVQEGYQAAIMAPTEILAGQLARRLKEFLNPWGIQVGLLTGSVSNNDRKPILERTAEGSLPVLVGTHALIEDGVKFSRLGFALIDEQHRFGVVQRGELIAKGVNPHVLVMTATPIPRSLALTLYGDLDVSVINELPKNRGSIKTALVTPRDVRQVHELIRREIEKGHQAYVVCPAIEETEDSDIQAATQTAEELAREVFPQQTIGLLHGRLKSAEKDNVMNAFAENRIQILVSTTVIEVGIDVPNATVMVIEQAERFGLSQLHQLRGRVGRGHAQSWCVLIGRGASGDSRERLKIMVDSQDGFVIAEVDLKLRGPGDFCGTRQSGLPLFRVADILRDNAILERAREQAQTLMRVDPHGTSETLRTLRREVERRHASIFRLPTLS